MTSGVARKLAYLFRSSREVRPLLLLGAGASFRSGIPLADEMVRRIARAAYGKHVAGRDSATQPFRVSDWMPFLTSQAWFIKEPSRFAENFPLAVQYLLVPREFRREFFLEIVKPPIGINQGYADLAQIMVRRLCWTVLTTNFDSLLVEALNQQRAHLGSITVIKNDNDLPQFGVYHRAQVVFLHGDVASYTDRNLENETNALSPDLVKAVLPMICDSPVIVIGYRGAEQSVVGHLLTEGINQSGLYRNGIYWCLRAGESLHPRVEELRSKIGSNFELLEIDGFDELMSELLTELKEDALYLGSPNKANKPRVDDDEVLSDTSVADLDRDQILETLVRYCGRLGLPLVDSTNYMNLLMEQGLIVRDGQAMRPTRACYLLFGKQVATRFPQAAIDLTFRKKGRQHVVGNLISQFTQLSQMLNDQRVNPTLRVKETSESVERRAYPERTILELLVNLLVHRDYSREEISQIDVVAGSSIEFRNPGGLPDSVFERVQPNDEGKFNPARSITELRNPGLADVFFGLGPMDKAGSGLSDVQEMMHSAGGQAAYAVVDGNRSMVSTLYQPRQSAPEDSRTAVPLSEGATYVTNLLPLSVVPKRLTVFASALPPRGGYDLLAGGATSPMSPLCVMQPGRLITFAEPEALAQLPGGGFLTNPQVLDTTQFLTSADNRRIFVWLLGRHFEELLRSFSTQGLAAFPREKRAYFTLLSGDRLTVVYSSTQRRNIRRDVVKPRGTASSKWHENEGVNYAIIEVDGSWCVQLKPFYMFTASDGRTPLPPSVRTRYSVRRMKFDRTPNVDSDMRFWVIYLSRGQPTINLGGSATTDLILSPVYASFEVLNEAQR